MKTKLSKLLLPVAGLVTIVAPVTILSSCNEGDEPEPKPQPVDVWDVEFDGESDKTQAEFISEERTQEYYNVCFSSHYALNVTDVSVKVNGSYVSLDNESYEFDEEEGSEPGAFKWYVYLDDLSLISNATKLKISVEFVPYLIVNCGAYSPMASGEWSEDGQSYIWSISTLSKKMTVSNVADENGNLTEEVDYTITETYIMSYVYTLTVNKEHANIVTLTGTLS